MPHASGGVMGSPSHDFLALTRGEKWAYTQDVATRTARFYTTKVTDEKGRCDKIVADSVLGALRNYLSHLLCIKKVMQIDIDY